MRKERSFKCVHKKGEVDLRRLAVALAEQIKNESIKKRGIKPPN